MFTSFISGNFVSHNEIQFNFKCAGYRELIIALFKPKVFISAQVVVVMTVEGEPGHSRGNFLFANQTRRS